MELQPIRGGVRPQFLGGGGGLVSASISQLQRVASPVSCSPWRGPSSQVGQHPH